MTKHKTKYIFECTGPKELTEFNEDYNKRIQGDCERKELFVPTHECLNHWQDKPCIHLDIHKYKGK